MRVLGLVPNKLSGKGKTALSSLCIYNISQQTFSDWVSSTRWSHPTTLASTSSPSNIEETAPRLLLPWNFRLPWKANYIKTCKIDCTSAGCGVLEMVICMHFLNDQLRRFSSVQNFGANTKQARGKPTQTQCTLGLGCWMRPLSTDHGW